MAFIKGNRYLNHDEMANNAQIILDYLITLGWSVNAICAMLGNMETESTINSGIWQNLDEGNTSLGYGLVQWTPATKYIEWATLEGYAIDDYIAQLERIEYEIENNIQWISTNEFPLSFSEFKRSTQSVEYLAEAFLKNYERPQNQNQPERSTQARYWYDVLNHSGGSGECVQLAQFPMNMIQITQGENGEYSHLGTYSIDFVGTHDKYPYYAPCDCECVYAKDDITVWRSIDRVMCADGVIRKIFWSAIHEVPLSHSQGTILFKGELMGHTGVGGTATGDHVHFQVMEGDTYEGFTRTPEGHNTLVGTQLHMYDVFAVNNVTILNGFGYNWRTSDWVDCGNVVPKSDNKLITLLLCDALNGWKY